jgi:SAM-dependent methyltransferase
MARLPPEVLAYYGAGLERDRLAQGVFKLERARTEEILQRFLPPPPASVLDVGGGSGVYAFGLAERGYAVGLVDPVPLHVEQARAAEAGGGARLAEILEGDARALPHRDGSQDAILLLGPLYHLTEREERLLALREARRVLRPGGRLIAAAISRFASLLGGVFEGLGADEAFAAIVEGDLRDGQHRNPTGKVEYFTTAFFHHPEELRAEVAAAGFEVEAVLGIEGPFWTLQGFEAAWADPVRRRSLLDAARAVESEPSLLGASAHLMAVGRPR